MVRQEFEDYSRIFYSPIQRTTTLTSCTNNVCLYKSKVDENVFFLIRKIIHERRCYSFHIQ